MAPPSTTEPNESPQAQPQRQQAQNLGSFVWSIAEILRGDFKQADYGKVIRKRLTKYRVVEAA